MAIDFSKNRDKDIEEITEKLFAKLQKQGLVAEEIGEQVGESFADGIEQGFDDAANRIAASSLKINKAFKDLAKRIANQKDIFNISLGGKNVVLDIDFSDVDINGADFQKKMDEVFEKFKMENSIEFDSKAAEKQFKDMLGLHTKYADKLSKLREQKPKLTNPAHIKANAQEQLAVIDGLKEIQRVMEQTSGISLALPRVYFGDTKELHNTISLMEQMGKGEEKVAKQRDTNAKKISKEKKELAERNKVLEEENKLLKEQAGLTEGESVKPDKKPRPNKSSAETSTEMTNDVIKKEITELVLQYEKLKQELGSTAEFAVKWNDAFGQVQQGALTASEAVAKLREEMIKQSAAPKATPAIPGTDDILSEFKEGISADEADDIGDIEAENGALERRLELLKDIAEQHGVDGLNKDAKAYYKLWLKEMDGENFTDKQDERYSETSENLEDAAKHLVDFEKTYDRIIVKFAKGKDLEILPNAKGLADLAKISDEYGESYNGKEIADIEFVRSQSSTEMAEDQKRATEETANIETKADEQAIVAEQTQLDLTKEELKVEKEITKEKEKQYGYHAGKFRDDGFKAENLWQSTPGRSTGFYGTGTYMTDETHLKEITTGQYGRRPLNVIDPDMYNLFDATNDKTASQLHQFLKSITNKAFGGKGENIKSLYANFKELFPQEQIITYEDFKALVGELQQYVKNNNSYPANKYMDSVSTKFMKNFGYEGVDTRGTKHADTTYGTVIYDLKEESIILKEITDEMQKQEIIAGNIASVVKEQTNARHKSEEPEIYETDSGQMSMLPAVEEEVEAKNKLVETNDKVAKSEQKVKEAAQGTQMTMDDIVPKSAEDVAPKVESEANALDKVGEAAENAAKSKKKFAKANKEVAASTTPSVKGLEAEAEAIGEVGENAKTAWSMTRPGVKSSPLADTSDTLDNFNLPSVYMGEKGQDAVQIFAKLKSEIEEMTGKPVIIDFVSDVNDEGQLEAVGASLKYVNEEAGITVKQFYDIKRNQDGVLVATQSHEKATLAAAKAAKSFNTEMQKKLALEQIKTLEGQMGELKLDLTEVKGAANAINDKASLEHFNLALRAAKEQAKQLKTELKGQNTLDTIASMERALLTLPSRLDEVERRLHALGDVEGTSEIDDVLHSINEEYQRFLSSDDSDEKVKLFRSLTSSMVWANAEMRNLSGKTSEVKRQETAAEKEELAKQKAARESYLNWWKATLSEQDEVDAYEKALLEREQKEKETEERIIAARKKKEEEYNAWWQKALYNKEKAPNLKYGKTTANSAQRKLEATEGAVDALGVTNPAIIAKMNAYKAKVKEVLNLRAQFETDPNAAENSALVKQFQRAAVEAENARRGIKAIIDEEQKMAQMSEEQGFKPIELSPDQISNLQDTMVQFAKSTKDGRVEIKGWNDDHTKMYYTVTNSKGVVEEMTMALGQGTNTMYQYRTATKETGTLIQQVFKGIKTKAKELLSFVIGGGSIYKVIEIFRQGIQYVKEIDLALTELRKVTDETEEEYDQFLQTAAKTGARLGSTISAVTEATATFAKLGYEMSQATEMAEAAIVYKNVGDNIESTEDAADSIISTMKGFRLEASESMEIVDRFNEVGNRFAITSQGIGEALRLSASALSEGGNSLDESIGLITAANEVVNDPSSVGTALKTLTLRLRGSKTELEEMGEDVSDMATTTSALQAKLLALTGGQVDIMLDANTFKNSTQILREMADAWEDMNDIQRASALELMGGKRQANVLSALIQNFDTVESVIKTSANSAGSALKENERYLDSIQGKIDQFNNAMQALSMNLLDSDLVKGIVEWGTKIIKSLDTTEGKLLGLVKAIALLMAYKKVNPLDWIKNIGAFISTLDVNTIKQYALSLLGIAPAMQRMSAETMANTLATSLNDDAKTKAILSSMGLTSSTEMLTIAQRKQALEALIANQSINRLTNAEIAAIAASWGLKTSIDATNGSIKVVDATTKSFMATNPIGWILAIVSVVMTLVMVLSQVPSRVEKLEEELSDLNSEISDLNSEIDSLNDELETAKDRMAELLALPSLSFIEQEELAELKQTTAELERQIDLKEKLAKNKSDLKETKVESQISSIWSGQGEWYTDESGIIREDSGWNGFWSDSKETSAILDETIKKYRTLTAAQDIYNRAQKELEDNGELSSKTFADMMMSNPVSTIDSYEEAENFRKKKTRHSDERLLENYYNSVGLTYAEDVGEGISKVLSAQNDFIKENDLKYGDNKAINKYLDEVYAYSLAYQQAQGALVESEAISSMFDATSTKELQEFGKTLQEIADSDLTDEQKNAKILKQLDGIDGTIGDGVKRVDGATDSYNRLHLAMEILGVEAQDISDYFVLETGVFDSNTIEGITNQYQHMESVLNALKNMSNNKFTFDGVEYDWDEFFSQDDQGKFKANVDKFSEILNGIDKDSRETFINIVESAANAAGDLSQIDWNQTLSKLDFSGLDRTFELLNNEFEALNNEMFAGAADEINGLIDTVSELQAALEDVAGTMDLLHTAQTQMNSSGRVSVKTALELMQTTEDWDQILEITNGTIRLRENAEEHLIQTELTAIQTQLHYAWTTAKSRYETALAAQGELDYADNSNVVMTAESIKAEAIGRVSAVVVALGAAMDEITKGNWGSAFSAFGNKYSEATATVVADAQQYATTLGELKKNAENSEKLYKAGLNVTPSVSDFTDNWDFDETPGDKYDGDKKTKEEEIEDGWEKLLAKYDNQLVLLSNERDLIQAEIDKAEARGGKASAKYYEDLKRNSEAEKAILIQKKAAMEQYLAANENAIDQDTWTDYNNEINETAVAIKECEQNTIEWAEAIREIDLHYFEQITDEVSRLGDELDFVNSLLEDEEVTDENGNWSTAALTRMGIYTQKMEKAAAEAAMYQDEIDDLNKAYAKGERSEEQYQEELTNLVNGQQDAIQSYEDAKDGIVELNEARIDVIKEGIEKEIKAYEDLIDAKKEELDAERDLYDFRKNIKNQTKEISELERRIASLSGSSAASDVAERRKLEAQLIEAKEGLNDTYLDHSRSAQDAALDEESEAYTRSKEKYIEQLEEQLKDTTTLIQNSIMDVLLNADLVYAELNRVADTYGFDLSDSLTQPWKDASQQAIDWKNELKTSMSTGEYAALIGEGGAITAFSNGAAEKLKGPWNQAKDAAANYAGYLTGEELKNKFTNTLTGFGNQIQAIINKWNGVKAAADAAYAAQTRKPEVGGNPNVGGNEGNGDGAYAPPYVPPDTPFGQIPETPAQPEKPKELTEAQKIAAKIVRFGSAQGRGMNAGKKGDNGVITWNGKEYNVQNSGNTFKKGTNLYKAAVDHLKFGDRQIFGYNGRIYGYLDGAIQEIEGRFWSKKGYNDFVAGVKANYSAYAKGTTGTTRDEWAITDEPQFGDELVLVPGKDGNLSFMRKGTGVVPADMTQKLFELAQIPTSDLMNKNLTAIVPNITKNDFKNEFTFESLVHVDTVDSDTLPKLEKMVDKKIDDFSKSLNYSLKKFTR